MFRRSPLTGIFAVALLVAVFGAVNQVLAADTWNKVESPHFLMVGEVGPARLKALAATLEQFRIATARMFPDRKVDDDRPLTVIVVAGNNIVDYGPGRSGNVAGFYVRRPDEDFIVMRSDNFGGTDFRTILHEYQHSITHASVRRLPRWLDEGVAEFYSTFSMTGDGRRYQVGLPIDNHLRTLRTSGFVPLEQFLTDDGRSFRANESSRVSVFYAESWALVHFFTFGDDGKWRPAFGPFLEALGAGERPMDAFRRTVTPDVSTFMTHFRNYPNVPSFAFVSSMADVEAERAVRESREGKLSVGETASLKAALLNDPKKEANAIEEDLAADPANRRILTIKAERLFANRQNSESVTELLTIARRDPSLPRACSLAMFALNVQRRYEEALEICPIRSMSDVGVVFERGIALEATGRQQEALPLYASLTTASEDTLGELRWRTWRYLQDLQYAQAGRAAEAWLARASEDQESIAYIRFVRLAALCLQQSPCDEARAEFGRNPLLTPPDAWVQNIARFFLGSVSADALLKLAAQPEQQSEAHAYIAFDLLARGQKDEALRHLKWVAERGSPRVTETGVATVMYKHLTTQPQATTPQ